MKRELIFPAIYKHFKHDESGTLNNYMYVAIGVAEVVDEFDAHKYKGIKELGFFYETETSHRVRVLYNDENKLFIPMKNWTIGNGKVMGNMLFINLYMMVWTM
ncbi:hypothetical protein FDC45_17770 [Clostridium botulinum]|uniref:Uncharacterized protein n=1 Tax=Clostridium botulinum TaxID=1491 RepID=A0A846J654_CLOBO|nr:hypothetical protein [Clostridium botulinum]ACA57477.1 hypothetical protein CLK_A0242 [Clostridium botulinum A3 str. Loch Maree]NFH67017.1 hypothetical protein [Clostridium botulinum]NFJ09606.1 hypothetical protein [Clostridium botulinum]NFK16575.1 hypothetical protein [Clostridium botulinum]NFM94300.1 hypothetical protein [Clostridium botulinum]